MNTFGQWMENSTIEQAWQTCDQGDLMLEFLANTNFPHQELVRLCVEIVRTVQHLNPDPRVSQCLDITEAWCDGKATLEEIMDARKGAIDASYVANAGAYAALAAAYSAIVTADPRAAACAANIANYTAYAANAAGNRNAALKNYVDLIRTRVPVETVVELVKG
jgi:hypothetical protein